MMADTDLLQAAERIAAQNQAVVVSLQNSTEPDLFAALAQRVQEATQGSSGIARMTAIDLDRLPRDSATVALGRRILARWSRATYDFLCKSGGSDDDLRHRLMSALTGREGGAPALLAGTLVAAFGLSPAVAALVAALLMKLVIAPAKDELCQSWAAALNAAGTAA
jgi:hypothetical protein